MQSYDLAMLILRWGLGLFFLTSGYRKVFVPSTREKVFHVFQKYGVSPTLGILIVWGQFLGGTALLLGFLNDLATIGLAAIMAGAIRLSVRERVLEAKPTTWTDWVSTSLCTAESMMAVMLLALAAGGPGRFSLDAVIAGWML